MILQETTSAFPVRGFNMCESLLRHSPQELREFLQRMKQLNFNTVIIHYDYGWKRYQKLILEECCKAGVEITLMVFGPRTFFALTDWESRFFAKDENGVPFTRRPECETHPCRFEPDALDAFEEGAVRFLQTLPPEIRHLHMRAGDGRMFCRCPRCRELSPVEQWQPFVERFVRAARRVRSNLFIETDVYLRRYELPQDCSAHAELDRIMFDPFPRSPQYPLRGALCAPPVHAELVQHLKAWCKRFPGKVYIHENAMKQGFLGVYRYGTMPNVEDLQLFRELGVAGVCYEAYAPGYERFAAMFELLSRAMQGEQIEYEPDVVENWIRSDMVGSADLVSYLLTTGRCDPLQSRLLRINTRYMNGMQSVESFRRDIDFLLEHTESTDWMYTGYMLCKRLRLGPNDPALKFNDLSPLAQDFCTRAKLWDFLEDLPKNTDPKACCRELLREVREKITEI